MGEGGKVEMEKADLLLLWFLTAGLTAHWPLDLCRLTYSKNAVGSLISFLQGRLNEQIKTVYANSHSAA